MAAAVAAPLGFPFTAAQWKELERQAMIYKYMVASLPVPSDLLIPATARNFPDPTIPLGNDSLYSLRYPNRDPEPGRCKRTDGKKWRCSREVAAYQKYCERHMHRGRPRSRKPVEVHPTVDSTNKNKKKKTRLNQSTPLQTNPTPQPNHSTKEPQNISKSFYTEPNRVDLGWMIDGEMGARNGIDQQWLHLMDNNKRGLPNSDDRNSIYGANDSIFHHGFTEEPLNLFSYPDLPQQEDIIQTGNNNCHLFLNSEDYPISRGNDLSHSSLNLSIAMAADSDHNDPKYCPISSWLPFSSGGPLAEVLQPSGSNPASPYGVNAGDSFSSSPSGVLQRALISQSDGSVCNSPTIGLSAALAPEVVAFQWLNSLRAQQTRFIIP